MQLSDWYIGYFFDKLFYREKFMKDTTKNVEDTENPPVINPSVVVDAKLLFPLVNNIDIRATQLDIGTSYKETQSTLESTSTYTAPTYSYTIKENIQNVFGTVSYIGNRTVIINKGTKVVFVFKYKAVIRETTILDSNHPDVVVDRQISPGSSIVETPTPGILSIKIELIHPVSSTVW